MFSLSSSTSEIESPESSHNHQSENRDGLHVMIPAFKATPSSILRETSSSSGRVESGASSSTSSTTAPPPPPHVPHEPYKGAVWSKPVRVRGAASSSLASTPRSSKPPSRASSRISIDNNSSAWSHRGDITIPSHSTVSVLSPPLPPLSPSLIPSEQKPVSVVTPVKAPSASNDQQTLENRTSLDLSELSLNNDSSSAVDQAFPGSTTEALRVEILRLREENRRLHAMRRSSCDSRRHAGESTSPLEDDSRTEEDVRKENESLKENVKTLTSQQQIQAQVNRDLKKLVIASIGDDLQYRFETISSSRAQLDQEASYLLKSLGDTKEELEKATIECDVWKSKFMASRVMVDGLAAWKASLQLKHTEMERALNLFIEENENQHALAVATNKNLIQLSTSLRRRYPQFGFSADEDESPTTKEVKSDKKRNLLDIEKENRRLAQSLNFEIGALIKVAEDRNLSNPSITLDTQSSSNNASSENTKSISSSTAAKSSMLPTPASSLARQVLQSEATTPPKLSNDAIAYLDMLFGPEGHPPGFTFKCCENCNGDIKTL